MTDREFDKIFQEKLAEHSEPVDGALWGKLSSSLDSALPVAEKEKKSPVIIFWKRATAIAGAVAAIILLTLFIYPNQHQSDTPQQQSIIVENRMETKRDSASWGNLIAESKTVAIEKTYEKGQRQAKEQAKEQVYKSEEKPAQQPEQQPAQQSEQQEAQQPSQKPEQKEAQKQAHKKVEENQTDMFWEYDPLYSAEERKGNSDHKISFALKSGFLTGESNTGGPVRISQMAVSGKDNVNIPEIEMISDAEYSLPINVGLQVQLRLNKLIAVGIGVNYSLLRSRYEGLVKAKFYNVKQTLHYLSFPINAYITILDGKHIYSYANGGFSIEKGLRANYRMRDYEGNTIHRHSGIKGFQYSANIGLGIEFKFTNHFGLYLEPNLVYFFNSDIPASIRTDEPLQFRGDIGFRFHIK